MTLFSSHTFSFHLRDMFPLNVNNMAVGNNKILYIKGVMKNCAAKTNERKDLLLMPNNMTFYSFYG